MFRPWNIRVVNSPWMSSIMEIESGVGNVYADLGFKDPEAMLRKAGVVSAIQRAMGRSGRRRGQAATIMGITKVQLDTLYHGQFEANEEHLLLAYLGKLANHPGFKRARLDYPRCVPDLEPQNRITCSTKSP
jgi:predicted XRE-type DNA-binding protein